MIDILNMNSYFDNHVSALISMVMINSKKYLCKIGIQILKLWNLTSLSRRQSKHPQNSFMICSNMIIQFMFMIIQSTRHYENVIVTIQSNTCKFLVFRRKPSLQYFYSWLVKYHRNIKFIHSFSKSGRQHLSRGTLGQSKFKVGIILYNSCSTCVHKTLRFV